MKLNPPNAHRSQIKIGEKRQTRTVQFRFMQNAFRILKPIQKSSKCVWVFRNTGANAFAKKQMRLAYEDKRDLYCTSAVDILVRWFLFFSIAFLSLSLCSLLTVSSFRGCCTLRFIAHFCLSHPLSRTLMNFLFLLTRTLLSSPSGVKSEQLDEARVSSTKKQA